MVPLNHSRNVARSSLIKKDEMDRGLNKVLLKLLIRAHVDNIPELRSV